MKTAEFKKRFLKIIGRPIFEKLSQEEADFLSGEQEDIKKLFLLYRGDLYLHEKSLELIGAYTSLKEALKGFKLYLNTEPKGVITFLADYAIKNAEAELLKGNHIRIQGEYKEDKGEEDDETQAFQIVSIDLNATKYINSNF